MSTQDSSNPENSVSNSNTINTISSVSSQVAPLCDSSSPISLGYFIFFLIAVIIGWILVDLWTKVIDNLAYVTLKLKPDSTWHSFIVAGVCSLIFLAYIVIAEPVGGDVKLQIVGSATVSALSPLSSITS